ncbi:MAG: hypothetical protein PGN34_13155 [Methylobacterium frigidaeris]
MSAIASYSAQSESAKTQNLANQITRQNAASNFARQDAALGVRQQQEQDAASAKKADVSLRAEAARATNTVASGESGIAGPTLESVMQDIYAQEGRYNSRVDTNLGWTSDQLQEEKKSASYQMKDRVNSVRDVQKPSFSEAGLKIGAAGLNAFNDFKINSKKWGE